MRRAVIKYGDGRLDTPVDPTSIAVTGELALPYQTRHASFPPMTREVLAWLLNRR
jgi:hypothetical protein